MNRRRSRWFAAAAGLAVLAGLAVTPQGSALAQTYSMSYTFDTSAASFHINRPNTSVNNGLDVYAGPFRASFNGTPPAGYSNPFAVFCVDLDHYDTATTAVKVQPFSTTAPAGPAPPQTWEALQRASWLYQHYLSDVMGANLVVTSWVNAAALQAAIWYVVEAKSSFTSLVAASIDIGHSNSIFYITADSRSAGSYGAIVSQANTYLKALRNANPNDRAPGTLFQVDPANRGISGGQDMLGPAPTPEGSSLLMLALGGVPVAIGVIRRRGKQAAGV